MKRKLKCTHTQFNGLHKAFEWLRSNGKDVTVDREALRNLLNDHALLMELHGNKVEDNFE